MCPSAVLPDAAVGSSDHPVFIDQGASAEMEASVILQAGREQVNSWMDDKEYLAFWPALFKSLVLFDSCAAGWGSNTQRHQNIICSCDQDSHPNY